MSQTGAATVRGQAAPPLRAARLLLIVAYGVLAFLPIALVLSVAARAGGPLLSEVGKCAALTAFVLLALQVVLSARLKFISRFFRLDRLLWFHKQMAIVAGVLLLVHPVLIALGQRSSEIFSFDVPWNITLGKASLLLLILVVLFALLFRKLKVNYRTWRLTHKAAIAIVILGFAHSLFTGSDLELTPMKLYWWLLLALAVGLFLYRNLVAPLRARHPRTSHTQHN
jgi:predicted ferric reductase